MSVLTVAQGKMQTQLYLITLHTIEPNGKAVDVQFTCTKEQLLHFQGQVDDAKQQVDKFMRRR